jgi:hypothetical protein
LYCHFIFLASPRVWASLSFIFTFIRFRKVGTLRKKPVLLYPLNVFHHWNPMLSTTAYVFLSLFKWLKNISRWFWWCVGNFNCLPVEFWNGRRQFLNVSLIRDPPPQPFWSCA